MNGMRPDNSSTTSTRRGRADTSEAVRARRRERLAKGAHHLCEKRMRAHSNRDRLKARGHDRRHDFPARENNRQGAGPEFRDQTLDQRRALFHRSPPPLSSHASSGKMHNQRIETRPLFCLENLYHRFGGKCVSRQAVDCLGRQGDDLRLLAADRPPAPSLARSPGESVAPISVSTPNAGSPARVARWLRPPRPFRRARSGVPFCAQAAVRACRKDANAHSGSASAAAQFGSPRLQMSPSRFTIAVGRNEPVAPNGRPQTARTCCSNWLVTQPSIVQCPELCGRGASSLMINSPSLCKNISTARSPTSSSLLPPRRRVREPHSRPGPNRVPGRG